MSIRVGVLGLNYGAQVHVPAYKADPRYEVVAVCARTPGQAEAIARENHIPAWYTDARQLLAAPDVDLVSIATPPITHAGFAAAALAAGKHAAVEVAFVNALEDARVLVDMAQECGRVGATAFALRYAPNLRLVKDLVAQEALGPLRLFRMDYFSNLLARPSGGWRWMRDAELGGGVLAGFISHAFDLALHWLGPVCAVDSTLISMAPALGTGALRTPADDTGTVTLHFESGLTGIFNFSAAVATTRICLELHGSQASLLVEGFGDEVRLLALGEAEARPVYPPAAYLEETRGQSGLLGGFQIFVDRLARALNGQAPPDLPTFQAGLEVTRLLEAVRRASREQRRVRLAEVS